MSTKNPLVVVSLKTVDDDDPGYEIYTAAYGLEMTVDHDWTSRAVLFVPYQNFDSIGEETCIGEETPVLCGGIIDLPQNAEGEWDTSLIPVGNNRWLLIHGASDAGRRSENNAKIQAALSAGASVVLEIQANDCGNLDDLLVGVSAEDCARVVLAVVADDLGDIQRLCSLCNSMLEQLSVSKDQIRVVVGGPDAADRASELAAHDQFDGIYLGRVDCDHYELVSTALEQTSE